jgi:Icc-related predicted phosphoesterase
MKKLCVISDTHGRHRDLSIPECDILFHCGDIANIGEISIYEDFNEWVKSLIQVKDVVFTAGNHDTTIERSPNLIRQILNDPKIRLLINQGTVVQGLKIWGSPTTPMFFNWAFMKNPGEDIQKIWDKIPHGIAILMTHGPSYGYLSKNIRGEECGCPQLLRKVIEIQPKLHLFGHIHSHGENHTPEKSIIKMKECNTICINASSLDEHYKLLKEPIVYEI